MSYFYKSRFQLTLIFSLVLLNLGTLTFMWLNRPPMHGRPGGQRENAGEFLIEKVGFNPDQREQYRSMREDHRQFTRSIEDSIGFYKNSLFKSLPKGDLSEAERISENIARLHKKIEISTFDHFVEVRNLCTSEQVPKFDAVIEEVLKMMAPSPGPPKRR